MKKYLMTGVAALAFAATFTSCSNHDDLFDQGAIDQQKEATVSEKYAAAFEKAFGKVGANVDWGFSSKAKTRSINVNGNLWPDYPTLGDTEETDVTNYVRSLTSLPNVNPGQLQNYFVTQVHKGTDTYKDLDNHEIGKGSDHMDNLQIAMTSSATLINGALSETGWSHINNFNSGNDTDWGGNTLVVNGGTYDFAYNNSTDSRYHNSWIAVNGADIDAALGVSKYAGYWYICFDFEATQPNVQTKAKVKMPNPERETEIWEEDYTFDGAQTAETLAGRVVNFRGTELTLTTENTNVYQYVNGNMVVIGNKVYDDWIIRLVPAEPITQPLYRVIAEDLTAEQAGDFDFNDVVFDVVKYENGKTTLRLQACGGTLPLKVGGVEVHGVYGQTEPNADGKYDMFNTGIKSHEPVDFTVDGEFTTPEQLLELPITVEKEGTWMTLTANKGVAACKILVDDRFPIVPERHNIANEQGNFTTYVNGNWKDNDNFWWIQTK